MRSFKFNIGDLLKYNKDGWISPAGCPEKHYTNSLRVEFRFWDGNDNVYVVTAEDGLGMFIIENNADLQEAADDAVAEMPRMAPEPEAERPYSLTRDEMLDFAEKMSFHIDDRLVPFSREQLRSEAWLAGYDFAKAHK